jgi:ketosteroid isomerase-like protein
VGADATKVCHRAPGERLAPLQEGSVRHRAFCERFYAAMQAGDFTAMDDMLDADFVLREPDGLPYAGTYRGAAGWRALCKSVIAVWADFKIRPLEYPGETDSTLVVRFAISGRSRRTGIPFDSTVLELWRFREGRLCEIHPYYWDTHQLATAHGM